MSGIWTHAGIFGDDGEPARHAARESWALGEGHTPLEEHPDLAAQVAVSRLFLKREDLNPSGSHKDRGLLYQVVRHAPQGGVTFVLSSSGNAAVSAAAACRITGNRLVAFVSPDTDASKLARLRASGATVLSCSKPINFARYAARVFGLPDLRGTRDPCASIGYRSLAGEIHAALPQRGALFTFSSSGISMEGIADGFHRSGKMPALWSVQSGECLGLVRAIEPEVAADPSSPAGRLGIRNPPHAGELAQRLLDSGGGALAVMGAEVRAWSQRLTERGLKTSAEGAAVLAGIEATRGLESETVVAILTGSGEALPPCEEAEPLAEINSYLDVRHFFTEELGTEPL
ncbi:MAG: PLP-dependent lyase/thiolase [Myxococcota bacterium]|nr:PLP-dependent lyase/thiolase [Myxococcota bacterium]